MGILFRNAEAIEVMRKVDTIVVDKTGTLTEGKPKLVSVVPVAGVPESDLLGLAASLERGSEHPLAAAITRGAEEKHIPLVTADRFESVTGKGVKGVISGKPVALGNRALMADLGVDISPLAETAEQLRADGQTAMFVSESGRPVGLIGVADPIKGDLRGIARARQLSRQTMSNIKQNLFFAFIYNSAGVPVAAGILYPFFGILLSPIIGAAAMSFSSVSVITNALRLKNAKL